jgi:hypothetical protein
MTRQTPVYVVCSPRPRVGKTLVARLLVDFFLIEGRKVAAFDLDRKEPSLRDYLPRHTKTADIAEVRGQMALFDRLIVDDKVAKIVDLGPAPFDNFFTVLRRIDFVAEARRRSVEPVILYIADPDRAAVRAYATLRRRLPQMTLIPVHNEIAGRGESSREKFPLANAASLPLHIPNLIPLHQRYIETPPFSFADFHKSPPSEIPPDVWSELQRWLRRIFVEFRELELRLLRDDLQASLLRSAAGDQ